jgi:hypothetical protein
VAVNADDALAKAHELALEKLLVATTDAEARRQIQMHLDRLKERPKDKPVKEGHES